jgi:hypothetical protein
VEIIFIIRGRPLGMTNSEENQNPGWWGRAKTSPSVYGAIPKKISVSVSVSGNFGVEIALIRNFADIV